MWLLNIRNNVGKYGVWNDMKKEFQFKIMSEKPETVSRQLFEKIGHDSKKWRFEIKEMTVGRLQRHNQTQIESQFQCIKLQETEIARLKLQLEQNKNTVEYWELII